MKCLRDVHALLLVAALSGCATLETPDESSAPGTSRTPQERLENYCLAAAATSDHIAYRVFTIIPQHSTTALNAVRAAESAVINLRSDEELLAHWSHVETYDAAVDLGKGALKGSKKRILSFLTGGFLHTSTLAGSVTRAGRVAALVADVREIKELNLEHAAIIDICLNRITRARTRLEHFVELTTQE